jgi:anti-anti-sigma factor
VADGITGSDPVAGPTPGGTPGPHREAPQRGGAQCEPAHREGAPGEVAPSTAPHGEGAPGEAPRGEAPRGEDDGDGSSPLAIAVSVTAGRATVVLHGELDPVTMPLLAWRLAHLLAGRPRHLVLDMTAVAFIDCASARLIAGTGRHLPPGARPAVRSPSPAVRQVLMLTGLAAHLDITAPAGEDGR